ncbi:hypothetical protein RCL1_004139 [Eukaryota sp. TZLM3-RCL]
MPKSKQSISDEQQTYIDAVSEANLPDIDINSLISIPSHSEIKANRKMLHMERVLSGDTLFPPMKKPKPEPLEPTFSSSENAILQKQIKAISSKSQTSLKEKRKETVNRAKEVRDVWGSSQPDLVTVKKTAIKAKVKAVPTPHPGQSYRPDRSAHEELLTRATEMAIKEEETEQNIQSALPKKNIGVLSGMAVGDQDHLPVPLGYSYSTGIKSKRVVTDDDNNSDSDFELNSGNNHESLSDVDFKKKIRKDAHEIPRIIEQLNQEQIQRVAAKSHRKQIQREEVPRMGPHKFQEPLPDVLTTDELPKAFYATPVESSALYDRIESVLRRGLMEPRKKQYKRSRYAIKMKGKGPSFNDILKERQRSRK